MSRASVLARGRAAAEAGMTDACVIERDTVAVLNTQTGRQTLTPATLYTGPCRIQQASTSGVRTVDVAEAHQLMLSLELQLPVTTDTANLLVGDRVRITSAVNDPDLAARTFRIRELAHKSEATARRIGVEEVT